MLQEFFCYSRILPQSEIKETIEVLEVNVSPNLPMRNFIIKLFDEIKTISNRDSFELFFEICGNHVNISDTSNSSYEKLIAHIDENSEDDKFDINLKITKNLVASTLSVYFIEALIHFLSKEKISNFYSTISTHFDEKLFFEVFSNINPFYSNCIVFFQSGASSAQSNFKREEKRKSQIEMFKENSSVSGANIQLLPSDFHFIVKSDIEDINTFFSKASGLLSLLYISSSSEFKADSQLTYKINGYKTVICSDITPKDIENSSHLLHKIYAWAYEGGNGVDKLGLVRNVLSIHLDTRGQIRFDSEAWEAIQSNYQVYLKENIQSYLEVKNKIGEFIIDSTAKTYNMADELLDSLKNNVLALLSFILTVVIVNGLKDNGHAIIFSDSYLTVVIILAVLSAFWLAMIRVETLARFTSSSAIVKEILRLNYNKIIMEAEINEIVDPVITKNQKYLEVQIKRYTIWWIAFLFLFVISFVVANRIHFEPIYDSDRIEEIEINVPTQSIPKTSPTDSHTES